MIIMTIWLGATAHMKSFNKIRVVSEDSIDTRRMQKQRSTCNMRFHVFFYVPNVIGELE